MKQRLVLLGLILAIVTAVVGCGGGGGGGNGGGSGGGSNQNHVFAGSYVGAFTDSGASTDQGVFAINIHSDGSIVGRYINTTGDETGLTTAGQITLISTTATTETGSVTVTTPGGTATGTLTLTTSTGTLTGSITNSTSGVTINFTSGLVSTATGGNKFAGFYSGTYTVNGVSGTPANTVAIIIDGNGHVTGLTVDNIAGQTGNGGIGIGTVNSSTGAATIGNSVGTLALSNGVLSGTLVNSGDSQTLVFTANANS